LKKKVKKEAFFIIGYFFTLFLLTLFLVHPRSVFIWLAFPLLSYLQFPWRFLTLVAFTVSLLGGGVALLVKEKWQPKLVSFLLILVVVLNYSFFRAEKIIEISDSEKLFSAKGWLRLQTDAIFDYLPIYAKAPPGGPAPEKPEVKEGEAEVTEVRKGSNWYQFKVEVNKEAKLQLPVYDFPGWRVWANGKETEITHDNFLGLITINLLPGDYQVKAKLTNTPVRAFSNTLSLISWTILLALFLGKLSKTKKKS
jgi:hypothetical protein